MTKRTTIHVTGHGELELTAEQIHKATVDQVPRPVRTYGVLIGSTLWPPRQLVEKALGIKARHLFNSQVAMRACNELGFATFALAEYGSDGLPIVPEDRRRGPNKN